MELLCPWDGRHRGMGGNVKEHGPNSSESVSGVQTSNT